MLCHSLLYDSVCEVDLGGLGVGEARIENITEGHEFIDFGDNSVLYSQRWDWNNSSVKLFVIYRGIRDTSLY